VHLLRSNRLVLSSPTQVRCNDIARLEATIPELQQGSIDAEHALSSHNYVQLFRLVQLAVEHLWQMRESHAKLYPAYLGAVDAAERCAGCVQCSTLAHETLLLEAGLHCWRPAASQQHTAAPHAVHPHAQPPQLATKTHTAGRALLPSTWT
jgi:hypothetical protein